MKTFYSAQDIEALARQGQRELVVDEHTVLTDLARDAAAHLGLRLVAPGRAAEAAPNRAAAAAVPAPAADLSGKPRGCQHGPAGAPPAAKAGRADGKVVDDLVSVVRQLGKGS